MRFCALESTRSRAPIAPRSDAIGRSDTITGIVPPAGLTRTIPNLSSMRNILLWRRVEQTKRRLVYDLYRMGLPTTAADAGRRIAFDILPEEAAGNPIMTGHLNGLITL